jgi:hypothetical protein
MVAATTPWFSNNVGLSYGGDWHGYSRFISLIIISSQQVTIFVIYVQVNIRATVTRDAYYHSLTSAYLNFECIGAVR